MVYSRGREIMRMILKDSEIGICISALDFYSRMYMGQYPEIDFELRQYRFDSEFDNQYMFARKHIYTAIRNLVFYDNEIVSDGTLWEAQTALYFRGFCRPYCAVL